MKINLKNVWSDKKNYRQQMFQHLVDEFCIEYDLDKRITLSYLTQSDKHIKILIDYLTKKGYKVTTFNLPGVKNDEFLSWGIELDDNCELTIALTIRYSE